MKPSILTSAILGACAAGSAWADCTTNPPVARVGALLTNTLVCGRPGADYPVTPPHAATDRWQEEHLANTDLFDYKLGPTNLVDPRKKVGFWQFRAGPLPVGGSVQYNYGGGGAFTYKVHLISGNTYSFCTLPGNLEYARATITPVTLPFPSSGCATFPP